MGIILIVTRSPLMRRNLVSVCRSVSDYTLETDSTISLISACLVQRVDLVIVDMDMDVLPTPQAIRCLRCIPKIRDIPVIALGNTPIDLQVATSAGANRALLKPVETSKLLSVISLFGVTREREEVMALWK